MSDERFGDRVQVSELSDAPIQQGGLPHPDAWAGSASVNTPFQGQAPAGPRRTGVETEYDPTEGLRDPLYEAEQSRKAQRAAPPAAPAAPAKVRQRPVPKVAKVTRKETSTLKRFREIFGLQRVAVEEAILKRRDPTDASRNVEVRFGLRGINYEDYQWVLGKTQELLQSPEMATFAWKISFMSMGVASIDGTPIWEVLGFEAEDAEHTRDPMYPHIGLRFQAAEAFCEELRTTLFDTVEHLYTEYEKKIDSKYLPKAEKAKADVPDEEEEAGESQGPLTPTVSES